MFTLEILKKVRDGSLRATNSRDIEAAAPLLLDYVTHGHTDTIKALFEERLRQARLISPEHERDQYWDLLHQIKSHHRKLGTCDIEDWLLSHYEAPRFSYHSEQEISRRNEEQQERQEDPTLPRLTARHRPFSFHLDLSGIMKSAIERLDRETALRTARIIARDFKAEQRNDYRSTTVKAPQTVLGLRGDTVRIEGHNQSGPLTIPHLKQAMALADEIDEIFGTTGTRYEFIKATFMQALEGKADPVVSQFILKAADKLSLAEKRKLVDHYTTVFYDKPVKSLCGVIEQWPRGDIEFCGDTEFFNRFIGTLEKWNRQYKSHDFLHQFFDISKRGLDYWSWEKLKKEGVYDADKIFRQYSPQLPWTEVTRRLELMRQNADLPYMKPFTFAEQDYLEIAARRALNYGHAKDLDAVLDYCASLPPEEQSRRRFSHGLPNGFPVCQSYDRLSRDPAILKLLTDRMPHTLWFHKEGYQGTLLGRTLVLASPNSNYDHFTDSAVSYVTAGQPMTQADIIASYDILFPYLNRKLPKLTDEERQNIAADLTNTEHGSLLRRGLPFLIQNGASAALGQWIKAVYEITPPQDAREFATALAYKIIQSTNTCIHVPALIGAFRAIRECDPDPNGWQQILEKAGAGQKELATLCVVHDLAPEMLEANPDEKTKMVMQRFFEKIPSSTGSLNDLLTDTSIELGIKKPEEHEHHTLANYNSALRQDIEPLLKAYDEQEQANGHSERAVKLACLFGTFRQVDTFLRRHAQPTRQPVHDLCLFDIPTKGEWDKELWGNLALRYGHPILRLLPLASLIETQARAMPGGSRALSTMKPVEIRSIASQVTYKRGSENRDIADFCIDLGASEEYFNQTLDLLASFGNASGQKDKDRMPDIVIDGEPLGLEGHRMERVPQGDALNLWIGKIVNCCNHLAGDGSDMARKQFNSPDNALYIIRDRRNRPVAKLSGWLSSAGNVVFNAWERKSDLEDFLLNRFALAAAIQILQDNKQIERVMLGAGPLHPKTLPFSQAANPETAGEHIGKTPDSRKQFVVADRNDMDAAYEMLDWEIAANMQRGETRIKLTYQEMQALHLA